LLKGADPTDPINIATADQQVIDEKWEAFLPDSNIDESRLNDVLIAKEEWLATDIVTHESKAKSYYLVVSEECLGCQEVGYYELSPWYCFPKKYKSIPLGSVMCVHIEIQDNLSGRNQMKVIWKNGEEQIQQFSFYTKRIYKWKNVFKALGVPVVETEKTSLLSWKMLWVMSFALCCVFLVLQGFLSEHFGKAVSANSFLCVILIFFIVSFINFFKMKEKARSDIGLGFRIKRRRLNQLNIPPDKGS